MVSVIDIVMIGAAFFMAGLIFGTLHSGRREALLRGANAAMAEEMFRNVDLGPHPTIRVCRDDPNVVELHDPETGATKWYRFDGECWIEERKPPMT